MLDKLNWPTALVALGGIGGLIALVYLHALTLPTGAGAAAWGIALAFMERMFVKPGQS